MKNRQFQKQADASRTKPPWTCVGASSLAAILTLLAVPTAYAANLCGNANFGYANCSIDSTGGNIYLGNGTEINTLVNNRGSIIQSGNAELHLMGGLRFLNGSRVSSLSPTPTYEIQNDMGIRVGSSGLDSFENSNATLLKSAGSSAGGFGVTHNFSGITTSSGSATVSVNPDAMVNVSGTWRQQGTFNNSGSLKLAAGSVLDNSGTLNTVGGTLSLGAGSLLHNGATGHVVLDQVQATAGFPSPSYPSILAAASPGITCMPVR